MEALNERYSKDFEVLAQVCYENDTIDSDLYEKYDVKRGLRDRNGKGVLAGLTKVSQVISFKEKDGQRIPIDGVLRYRGYNVHDLIRGILMEDRYGFEEVTFLLLFGKLPDSDELERFKTMMNESRELPINFVRDVIMKHPNKDMMVSLSKSVLTLSAYDENVDDISVENVLKQCVMLISTFPLLAVYAYQAHVHYNLDGSLYIHNPDPNLSAAENILRILRPDMQYTETEAKLLDISLILHMEHGGGNNSSFTTHVVSSSGTDTYSAIAAALGSLKGPKHGGANIKVVQMFEDLKKNVEDTTDEAQVREYLKKLLDKEAFDKQGLIYGMGHAVYSISDPRERVFKTFVGDLAREKHREEEYELYKMVERLAPEVIAEKRKIYKNVSPNVDFYSGFVYSMLGLPFELYTPMFAIARIVGWSAHRVEELINASKIIRPAYKAVSVDRVYEDLELRKKA